MVFGLFKSRSKQQAADLQHEFDEVLTFLREMDLDLRACVAMSISTVRLRHLAATPADVLDGDLLEHSREAWYDPLKSTRSIIKGTMGPVERLRASCTAMMMAPGQSEEVKGETSFVLAATRVMYNTWQACLHREFLPQAREMWRLLAESFPHVEPLQAKIREAGQSRTVPEDGPDSSDYRRIPEGFGPETDG